LDDVDPVALERRLGQIEGSVGILATEMKNLALTLEAIRVDVREAAKPHNNWAEWASVAVSTICAVAVGIGIYVAPMEDSIMELQAKNVRQDGRILVIEEKVNKREGDIKNYYDHLNRYHNVPMAE
jgi:hypothetical protein